MFVSFIQNLEHYSNGNIRGESELLLVELKDNVLSYQNTMQFHLDNMLRDRVIGSIPQFLKLYLEYVQIKIHYNKLVTFWAKDS